MYNIDNYTQIMADDRAQNEVKLVDEEADETQPIRDRAVSFSEVSSLIGLTTCLSEYDALGCASSQEDPRTGRVYADILLPFRQNELDTELEIPGRDGVVDRTDAPFSGCLSTTDRYVTMLHEAGHALGITGLAPLEDDWNSFVPGHSTIPGSLMNPDGLELYKQGWGKSRLLKSERECGPHPWDIMALYALYQTD
ncbi:MAG: hypothetical protein OXN21_05810 [Chloroflexota bacterium]|nr:hypothetical protein [Chloroflexota bacterium]